MTNADIGQPIRIVVADRNVAGAVDHEIVDAAVPFQFERRIQIAIRDEGVLPRSRERVSERPSPARAPLDGGSRQHQREDNRRATAPLRYGTVGHIGG